MSNCISGAPVSVSHPHFLNGDKELRTNVTGLDPDLEKHKFYMDLHSVSGHFLSIIFKKYHLILINYNSNYIFIFFIDIWLTNVRKDEISNKCCCAPLSFPFTIERYTRRDCSSYRLDGVCKFYLVYV